MGKVWRAKFLVDTKLNIRAKVYDVDAGGVLVPQPDDDTAAYLATHPSFALVKQKSVPPASRSSVQSPAPVASSEHKISESDPSDPESMTWPELRSYAAGLGIKAKSKKDILAALADRS